MIKIILGLILLLLPFLLINKFENKKLGFFYIFSFMIGFHLFVSVITQLFGIFNYEVIFGINLLVAVFVFIRTDFRKLFEDLKRLKIDWMLIFIIIVLFIQLYSVHYNYAGEVTTIQTHITGENIITQNMKYTYPYVDDEWASVSLIKYSIISGKLPLVNPLWDNIYFPNPQLGFHSFVSGLILLLNLNPLTQYVILTIFFGMLICLLVYFILRFNKLGKFPSAIACLSVLYIINGANLPGIWTLNPIILGVICFLLSFLFMTMNKIKMVLFLSFLSLLFYPPLFVLYAVSLIFYFIFINIPRKEKYKYLKYYLFICVVVGLILLLFAFKNSEFISYILSKLYYPVFKQGVQGFKIWEIVPSWSLLLAGLGIFELIKRKIWKRLWLIMPVLIGLIYWLIYSRVLWRFIIQYERVVFATSILIVLLSGFGLYFLIKYLKKIDFIKKYYVVEILSILVLLLFFYSAFSYTQRDNWKELTITTFDGRIVGPASPINTYLHEDDLRLFENISEKNFLSVPWKGLVIGVATSNYPLDSKSATITNKIIDYNDFMSKNCRNKNLLAKNNNITYIYSQEFTCPKFKLIGKSEEGFYLYEFFRRLKDM